jgi:hypothetical protein
MFVSVSTATGDKKSKTKSRSGNAAKPTKVPMSEKVSLFIFKIRSQPLFVPTRFSVEVDHGLGDVKEKDIKSYDLSFLQKIFLLFDDPISWFVFYFPAYDILTVYNSSSLAVLYQILMFLVIIMSCIVYVVSTLPAYL